MADMRRIEAEIARAKAEQSVRERPPEGYFIEYGTGNILRGGEMAARERTRASGGYSMTLDSGRMERLQQRADRETAREQQTRERGQSLGRE